MTEKPRGYGLGITILDTENDQLKEIDVFFETIEHLEFTAELLSNAAIVFRERERDKNLSHHN